MWKNVTRPCTIPSRRRWKKTTPKLESDPLAVRSRAYDLVLNGFEVGGGSIRIHDMALQQRVFAALGMQPRHLSGKVWLFAWMPWNPVHRPTAGSPLGSTVW